MAGGRLSWKRFLKKDLVRLYQAKQQGEKPRAQTQTQCDAQNDGEKEEDEFHGGYGPFLWRGRRFRQPTPGSGSTVRSRHNLG
jgi:hypothetical protein